MRLTLHLDIAAMNDGDAAADVESHSGAGNGGVDAVEALEDVRQVLAGDADAGIGDVQSGEAAATDEDTECPAPTDGTTS